MELHKKYVNNEEENRRNMILALEKKYKDREIKAAEAARENFKKNAQGEINIFNNCNIVNIASNKQEEKQKEITKTFEFLPDGIKISFFQQNFQQQSIQQEEILNKNSDQEEVNAKYNTQRVNKRWISRRPQLSNANITTENKQEEKEETKQNQRIAPKNPKKYIRKMLKKRAKNKEKRNH